VHVEIGATFNNKTRQSYIETEFENYKLLITITTDWQMVNLLIKSYLEGLARKWWLQSRQNLIKNKLKAQ